MSGVWLGRKFKNGRQEGMCLKETWSTCSNSVKYHGFNIISRIGTPGEPICTT
jgi:hypothetical protein